MSPNVPSRLREFARGLLERSGSAVEWPDDAPEGLAVLPAHAAEALKCLEILPLSFQADAPVPINLATDFLDRVRPLLDAVPRVGYFQVPQLYLKQSNLEEPIARKFSWLNAQVKVRQTLPVRVEYHTWFILATLDSADRWEQVLRVSLNSLSGAEVDLEDPLSMTAPGSASEPARAPAETWHRAARGALARVETHAAAFVIRLELQRERDRTRLRGYYNALVRESRQKASRAGAAPGDANLQAKQRAVDLELRRKLAELDERYALRAELAPLAMVRLSCPALAVQCEVHRKQARRIHTLYWNPLLKELEPLCCHACGASTFAVSFTDEDVQPQCRRCAG